MWQPNPQELVLKNKEWVGETLSEKDIASILLQADLKVLGLLLPQNGATIISKTYSVLIGNSLRVLLALISGNQRTMQVKAQCLMHMTIT
jgi:hypothetical protein